MKRSKKLSPRLNHRIIKNRFLILFVLLNAALFSFTVNLIFIILALSGTIFSQSADFGFDPLDCQECDGDAKSVIRSSSFWLSESPAMDPASNNRIIIQSGTLSSIKKIIGEYPNFDFGIKVTRNLAITGKLFGFSTAKESPQILGAGIQYYYGGGDTLNWVSSIQRVDLKGLSHFRLTSLTFDIRKWIEWKSIQFRIGIGSNFFNERSYKGYSEPSSMKGQINFVGADALKSYSFFKYGIGTRIHPGRTLVTFFIQKELF